VSRPQCSVFLISLSAWQQRLGALSLPYLI
jgi:hypothetical protein